EHRDNFFRDDLRGIEQIEIKALLVLFLHDLNAELPFRIRSGFNGFPKIAAMKVGILAGYLLRLIPGDGMYAEQRLPMKLHETRLARGVDESESMNSETLHHAETSGNGAIRHDPHDHVHRFRHHRNKIPK